MEELTVKLSAFVNLASSVTTNVDEEAVVIVNELDRFFAAHDKSPSAAEPAPSNLISQFGRPARAAFLGRPSERHTQPGHPQSGAPPCFYLYPPKLLSASTLSHPPPSASGGAACVQAVHSRDPVRGGHCLAPGSLLFHSYRLHHRHPRQGWAPLIGPLSLAQVLELVWSHANLAHEPTEGDEPQRRSAVEVAAEACRCLVNLQHQSPDVLAPQLHAKGMGPFLRALEREDAPLLPTRSPPPPLQLFPRQGT